MKLLLACLFAVLALTYGYGADLEFKMNDEVNGVESFDRLETADLASNDGTLEKRGFYTKCQMGYQVSKYCHTVAKTCFGPHGQKIFVRFAHSYRTPPKVVIGLTLVDTHKDQNVRVRATILGCYKNGFLLQFKPWWYSITYQIGVNWMACP